MSDASPPDVTVGQVNPWAVAENGQADSAVVGTPSDAGKASTVFTPGTELARPIDISDRIAATSSVCCCRCVAGAFGASEPQPATRAAASAAMSACTVERVTLTSPVLSLPAGATCAR